MSEKHQLTLKILEAVEQGVAARNQSEFYSMVIATFGEEAEFVVRELMKQRYFKRGRFSYFVLSKKGEHLLKQLKEKEKRG